MAKRKKQKTNFLIPDVKITSISDMLKAIQRRELAGKDLWYRGHASIRWSLLPSLCRDKQVQSSEAYLMTRFKQDGFRLLDTEPTSEWDWLFLMQHHRVPTRLLDWTEHPLVALYFALSEPKKDNQDGVLWTLLPSELNKNANITYENKREIPLFYESESGNPLNNYLPSKLSKEKSVKLLPAAGIAMRNSARIAAQFGVFTITHRENHKLEKLGDGKHLFRMVIPKLAKKNLRKELQLLKVNQFTIFPELDSVSRSIKDGIYG